jgi:hypothetical protein
MKISDSPFLPESGHANFPTQLACAYSTSTTMMILPTNSALLVVHVPSPITTHRPHESITKALFLAVPGSFPQR